MATTTTKKKPTAKKTATTRKKKPSWGGRREGAGRKVGTKLVENPRNKGVTFMVSEKMLSQIRQLREATKQDEVTFNEMFVKWVAGVAEDYGIVAD